MITGERGGGNDNLYCLIVTLQSCADRHDAVGPLTDFYISASDVLFNKPDYHRLEGTSEKIRICLLRRIRAF